MLKTDDQLRADLAAATSTWHVAFAWENYRERRATSVGLWTGLVAGILAALTVPHVPADAITPGLGRDSVNVLLAQIQLYESATPDPLLVALAAAIPVAVVTAIVVGIYLFRVHRRHGIPRWDRSARSSTPRDGGDVEPPEGRLL